MMTSVDRRTMLLGSGILAILFGALLPVVVHTITTEGTGPTYIDANLVQMPGTPILESPFAEIANETADMAIYPGVSDIISTDPVKLEVTVPDSTLNEENLTTICDMFVTENYQDTISRYKSRTSQFNAIPWRCSYQNNHTTIYVWMNQVTGKVTQYVEVWNLETEFGQAFESGDIEYSIANNSQANTAALDFLKINNYTIPNNSRYLRTYQWGRGTIGATYEVTIQIPSENIFGYYNIQISVNALLGRVTDFQYRGYTIAAPNLEQIEVVGPEYAKNQISQLLGPWRQLSDIRYLEWFLSDTTEDSIVFQLAWVFEEYHSGFWDTHAVDAITGSPEDLHSDVQYSQTVIFEYIIQSMLIIGIGGIIAYSIIRILARK